MKTAPPSERSVQGGTPVNEYLFLHRDYLGSIVAITDVNGLVKEKRHFDAWGNIAKLQNGSGATLSSFIYADRGYTGHEHLINVGLIHMNGRLYDPVLHRFIMPDNYVQDPYNTQNFNRYGYVYNNPLLYGDPSGEWIHIAIGALVGGVINVATNWSAIQSGGIGQGLGYFAVGAASGAVGAGTGNFAFAGAIMGGGNTTVAGGPLSQVALGAVTGAAGGAAGGAVGGYVSKALTNVGIGGFVGGTISGAAGGFAGGFTAGIVGGVGNNLINGNSIGDLSFGDIFGNSLSYGAQGAALGGAFGGVTQGAKAYGEGKNVWTGTAVAPGRGQFSLSNTPATAGFNLLHINGYNADGQVVSSEKIWGIDSRLTNKSISQYDIYGMDPYKFYKLVTGSNGPQIQSLSTGVTNTFQYQGNTYTYQYYISSPRSSYTPTIALYINSVELVKYRFPSYR